jgi:hypothetical protein
MNMPLKFKAAVIAAILVPGFLANDVLRHAGAMTAVSSVERPTLIELVPGSSAYRMAGEFNEAGRPVRAPLVEYRQQNTLEMMRLR